MQLIRVPHYDRTVTEADRQAGFEMGDGYVDFRTWEEANETACREIARGEIVARLVEVPTYRMSDPVTFSVVKHRDGTAAVIVDSGAPYWTTYRVASVEVAIRAARAILSGGSAFNW